MRWETMSADPYGSKAARLLEDGWEPFAVTSTRGTADSFSANTVMWFRRPGEAANTQPPT